MEFKKEEICEKTESKTQEIDASLMSLYDSINKYKFVSQVEEHSKRNAYLKEALNKCFTLYNCLKKESVKEEFFFNVRKETSVSCEISVKHNIYTIKYDRLLPARAYDMLHTENKRDFTIAFEDAYNKLPVQKRFDRRVAVEVIHHYSDPSHVKDYDNIESKKVIDCISLHLLIEDDPKYMSLHFDYKMDEKEYTEIKVMNEKLYQLRKLLNVKGLQE